MILTEIVCSKTVGWQGLVASSEDEGKKEVVEEVGGVPNGAAIDPSVASRIFARDEVALLECFDSRPDVGA